MLSQITTFTSVSAVLSLPACADPRCRCQRCVHQRLETFRRMIEVLDALRAADAEADEHERPADGQEDRA